MEKRKIMLVDDKDTIAKIVAMYLSADYDFEYFPNPLLCISKLNNGVAPDLIISDIMMPEMKGDAFLRFLKAEDKFKSIPVVMLSSEDSSSERVRLLEDGAADYIVKPFNPMELKVRIKRILG